MGKTIKKPTNRRDKWMSPGQAAKALKVSRTGVLGMISRGELETIPAAGKTLVSRASVDRRAAIA